MSQPGMGEGVRQPGQSLLEDRGRLGDPVVFRKENRQVEVAPSDIGARRIISR